MLTINNQSLVNLNNTSTDATAINLNNTRTSPSFVNQVNEINYQINPTNVTTPSKDATRSIRNTNLPFNLNPSFPSRNTTHKRLNQEEIREKVLNNPKVQQIKQELNCNKINYEAGKEGSNRMGVYNTLEDLEGCAPAGQYHQYGPGCNQVRSNMSCLYGIGKNPDPCAKKSLTAGLDSFLFIKGKYKNEKDVMDCAPNEGSYSVEGGAIKKVDGVKYCKEGASSFRYPPKFNRC